MVPGRAEQIEYRGLHREGPAERVDEFAGVFADDLGPKNATALGLGDDFHVAVIRLH